jgi:CheY-like chemotaxis protein
MSCGAGAILLVEDNEDDAFFFERALKASGISHKVFRAEDGQQAINYLSGSGEFRERSKYPAPKLIFLDLKLPIVSGLEVLAWIRAQSEYRDTSVVVLTSSNEPDDFTEAHRLGANCYKVKPLAGSELLELAKAVKLLE